MKKKWTPHIIAAGVFMVFIVLSFLACVSVDSFPRISESSAPQTRTDSAPRTGGRIVVQDTFNQGYYYTVFSGSEWYSHAYYPVDRGNSYDTQYVKEDGKYIVYYEYVGRDANGRMNKPTMDSGNRTSFPSKTVYVSNGQKVTVNLP